MPQYRAQIFKSIGGGKEWSNTYHILADDPTEASAYVAAIVGAEVGIHKDNVTFLRSRLSTSLEGDGFFITTPINLQGARPVASGQLPLFNVVRVDLNVFGGRPSYKFLRLPIEELEQQNGVLTDFMISQVEAEYVSLIEAQFATALAPGGIVDEDGGFFLNGSVFPRVQERQLSRRRRRSSSGGISAS